jgi:hypothetical protein
MFSIIENSNKLVEIHKYRVVKLAVLLKKVKVCKKKPLLAELRNIKILQINV